MTRYGLPDARAAEADGGPPRILVLDFATPAAAAGFRSIDDVVMGGVSASRVSVREGALRFARRSKQARCRLCRARQACALPFAGLWL